MAARGGGGGRGAAEGRGHGGQAGCGANFGHGSRQSGGGAENFTGKQGFNNFYVGGPSRTAGGGNQNAEFFNGGYQGVASYQGAGNNGFQLAAFQGGPGFQGLQGFNGTNAFPAATGFAPIFQPYGFQAQPLFNVGSGFDGNFCGGGGRNRRGCGGGRVDNSSRHGRGRTYGTGRGEIEAKEDLVQHEQSATAGLTDVAQQGVAGGLQEAVLNMPPTRRQPAPQAVANGAANADAILAKKGKKSADKLKCNRCNLAGQFAAECVSVLCDFCERYGHANAECPLHLAPKPQLRIYGLCDDELMFFELPLMGSYKPKMENSRAAMISIQGGVMTPPQIVSQLQRLVPVENFVWDVSVTEDNNFRVLFPSKEDLERLKVFGTFQVPNSVCTMTVVSWGARVEPLYLLPEVWVRVHGIPPRHRGDYLALWAVGDLFGKTIAVDMPYTRQHGVVRLRVDFMDYSKIPANKHMFVKSGFFDLQFEVEDAPVVGPDAVMAEAPRDDTDPGGDDQGGQMGGSYGADSAVPPGLANVAPQARTGQNDPPNGGIVQNFNNQNPHPPQDRTSRSDGQKIRHPPSPKSSAEEWRVVRPHPPSPESPKPQQTETEKVARPVSVKETQLVSVKEAQLVAVKEAQLVTVKELQPGSVEVM
ncbi:hypothetical protein ACQ4PT_004103 [Festuca glaucescens]